MQPISLARVKSDVRDIDTLHGTLCGRFENQTSIDKLVSHTEPWTNCIQNPVHILLERHVRKNPISTLIHEPNYSNLYVQHPMSVTHLLKKVPWSVPRLWYWYDPGHSLRRKSTSRGYWQTRTQITTSGTPEALLFHITTLISLPRYTLHLQNKLG